MRRGLVSWSLLARGDIGMVVMLMVMLARAVGAQAAARDLDSPEDRLRRLLPFLALANSAPCERYPRTLSGAVGRRKAQRAWVTQRVSPFERPYPESGTRKELRASGGGLSVHYVEFRSRVAGAPIPAYVVEPEAVNADSAAVVVIHGTRTSFEQAIAWSFGQAQASNSTSPIIGIALMLAQHGMRVLVPFVDDERSYSYLVPWSDLGRFGTSLGVRGLGNGASLVHGHLAGALDYLTSTGAMRIGVVGDREGAALALQLAAVDRRVDAVASLMPPLDRPALRSDVSEFRRWPLFTQAECALTDEVVASAVVPKPLLMVSDESDRDQASLVATFGSASVASRIVSLFTEAGVPERFRVAQTPNRTRAQMEVARWFSQFLRDDRSGQRLEITEPKPSAADRYPTATISNLRAIMADATSGAAPFTSLDVRPDVSSEEAFIASVGGTRRRAWRLLTGSDLRSEPAARIIKRDTVRANDHYVLEKLTLQWDRLSLRIEALLATPTRRASGVAPLVFSLDISQSANELFGLPPSGETPYLGAYGDVLARQGYIVFAPIVEPEIPNLLSPLFRSRMPSSVGAWSVLLPLYRATLGTALQTPGVDVTRVTAYGISYAGYAALSLAAFDARITQLVYSNPAHVHALLFSAGVGDPAPWLSDGSSVWDVIERYLIFPRRFIREVESTERYERSEYQRVREIEQLYGAMGRSDRFHFIAQPGGHQTKIEPILPFLREP